ncbi:MAG: 3-phosphoshikimate 1-carboxyvinyltransferase, partial [Candidatus Marinimicrobia bacterium]|nr:3-phosphoshikimate 1-carboxyvinyltransferase [Candidatus Neomarinimicrobiota bacterium]
MRISGELTFPGDKSISHRALMLAALTNGECIIDNLSTGVDVESTRQCLMTCGVQSKKNGKQVVITGNPLKNPASDLDCGNSGTTARLLTGLLAGQRVTTTLTGDKSLSQRPMERIIQPLGLMGASFENENGYLPLRLNSAPLTGIEYSPPVASAQVKSAILFAGLGAEGETTVIEKTKTRDHTERMLHVLGAHIRFDGNRSTIKKLEKPLKPFAMKVPGDPSTAAFFAAAAALVPGSNLILKGILSNPTRTGFFSALEKMGAGMECLKQWKENGEDVGDLRIFHQSLKGINISGNQIPTVIDELP